MRILCVSDVVVPALYPVPDRTLFHGVNLILACGDLPPEYVGSLYHAFNTPCLYVRGNHDIRYDARPPTGCVEIHGRIVRHGGLRIMGLGGSRWYNGGPNQYTEKEMRRIIRGMTLSLLWNGGVDIVVTHAPPRHVHDAQDLCHQGFHCFRGLIDKRRPKYFIHGHIHRQFLTRDERVTVVNTTKVINTYGYTIIEIPDGKAA